ncbi:hypothetical protein AX16_010969 [Volvariella volvacea WC 439]|nr:hypothetical protein AX16_010969 [Volvariella volvacea WC 439]
MPVVHSENATFWGRQSVDRRVENNGGNNQVNMDNSNGTIHGGNWSHANKADSEVTPRRHTDPLPSGGSSGSRGKTAPYSHDRPRSPESLVSEKNPPRDSLQNPMDASKQTSGRMNEDVLIELLHEMNKKMDAMAEDIKVLKTKFEERERDLDNSNATNGKNQCIIS